MRDELVGLIASWDKSGREGDRQFFLEAWNGTDDYDTDRIGRGTIIIPNLCVSIFGGMQPDKLTAYLEQASDALGNNGLLQRFQLLVYPDPSLGNIAIRSPMSGAEAGRSCLDRLAAFDPAEWGAWPVRPGIKFPYFFFDDAAQEVLSSGQLPCTKRSRRKAIRSLASTLRNTTSCSRRSLLSFI